MGYLDRDYQRSPARGSGFMSRFDDCPVVKWLLISNVVVFLLDIILKDPGSGIRGELLTSPLFDWGVFSIKEGLLGGQVWRLLTFQFLHVNFFHLLFNMYALFLFGPFVERYWRSRAFLAFYLVSGLAGALFFTLTIYIDILPVHLMGSVLLGASAGVFAVLIGAAIIAPEGRIRLLFPPIPMTMRTFALILLGFEVFLLLTNSSNAGGSAGHLGGALMGFLFFKVPVLTKQLGRLEGSGMRVVPPLRKPSFSKPPGSRPKYQSKLRPRSEVSAHASEVDRILDKISEHGLHSLTETERKVLTQAGKR